MIMMMMMMMINFICYFKIMDFMANYCSLEMPIAIRHAVINMCCLIQSFSGFMCMLYDFAVVHTYRKLGFIQDIIFNHFSVMFSLFCLDV